MWSAELLGGRGRRVEPGHHPTAVHDEERVGQADQLLEIGRDEHRGQTGGPRRPQLVPDRRLRADVDPSGGVGCDQCGRSGHELPADEQLLLVAARQRLRGHLDARRAHVVLGDDLGGPARAPRGRSRAPGVRPLGLVAEHLVLPERCLEQQPVPLAVLGHVAEPRLAPTPGRPRGDVLAAEADATGVDLAEAHQHLDELGLAVALDAGDADDLTPADLEADVRQQLPAVLGDGGRRRRDRRCPARWTHGSPVSGARSRP